MPAKLSLTLASLERGNGDKLPSHCPRYLRVSVIFLLFQLSVSLTYRPEPETTENNGKTKKDRNNKSVFTGDAVGYRLIFRKYVSDRCLQCFDTVGWAAGRASGL